ncbi:MAG: arylsulfatase [Planctomycetota bacterium]|nr:arylsulfatase [Planctomycetota bacterium]
MTRAFSEPPFGPPQAIGRLSPTGFLAPYPVSSCLAGKPASASPGNFLFLLALFFGGLAQFAPLTAASFVERPNVVIVLTDDQGYGDVGCHGNPVIKTPNIDTLCGESTSFTDYHVAPTCSPTRSALLTGHWTNRTGVWHTVNGRSMLRANEVTLGQFFKEAGYQTGMFGKWHLGDNYPYRPEDRGFTEVYRHGGGGVGQTPDVWDNAYFDGAYFHNGKIEKAKGFCTDVFFDQAGKFMNRCAAEKKPFLAYIATNAPHGPLHCPQKYLELYPDQAPNIASFFGMISNIDDNVGKTRTLLRKLGIERNTIFIFTTDNGTATGDRVFNAGMRGKKGSEYDGGHRVPFVIHWPKGNLEKKRSITTLTHAVDVVPSLLDLCGIPMPDKVRFDGLSFRALLDNSGETQWPDRFLVTDSQRVRDPIKWRKSSVMSQRWRLVNGTQLYDIKADPGQKKNVADQNPGQVEKMRNFYEQWWAELEPTFQQTTEIYIGHPAAPRVTLTGHDWIQTGLPPWNQGHIRRAAGYLPAKQRSREKDANRPIKKKKHEGHWAIRVLKSANYRITALRWPEESGTPITSGLPAGSNVPGSSRAFRTADGVAVQTDRATLRINGKDLQELPVSATDVSVTFEVRLEKGSHKLAPFFQTPKGELGAYYSIVKTVDD